MATRKYKLGELVKVEWIDALSKDSWEDCDHKLVPTNVISCGIVQEHNNDYITLAINHSIDTEQVSCLMCIPTGMIKRIRKLHEKSNPVRIKKTKRV
jgi:hypothetical protein